MTASSAAQRDMLIALRLTTAGVWLVFGLLFKALGKLPRHRQIIMRVVGNAHAGKILWLVALTEMGIGAWLVVGRFLPLCMAVQTALIASMNFCELRYARDLLLSPRWMLCANALFLALGWYIALNTA